MGDEVLGIVHEERVGHGLGVDVVFAAEVKGSELFVFGRGDGHGRKGCGVAWWLISTGGRRIQAGEGRREWVELRVGN